MIDYVTLTETEYANLSEAQYAAMPETDPYGNSPYDIALTALGNYYAYALAQVKMGYDYVLGR